MQSIAWDDKLLTGIKVIDEQHQSIFSLANQLHHSISQNQPKTIFLPLLNELLALTELHFKTEEDLMLKSNYPGFESHKRKHQQIIKKTKTILKMYQSDDLISTSLVSKFITTTVEAHIPEEDLSMANFLMQN
jgi:hemerythrin-like metal-binding protein